MPTYTFKDSATGESFEKFMKHSDKLVYLSENTTVQELVGAPALQFDPARLGRLKPDDSFREVLSMVNDRCVDMGGSCKTVMFDR